MNYHETEMMNCKRCSDLVEANDNNLCGPCQEEVDNCDHDWDDMGNGSMACTYHSCEETMSKREWDRVMEIENAKG